jgi:cellulose synthase/poly-beta-1,6-N-acetylglucosamine synthase-like glycosyltransferase
MTWQALVDIGFWSTNMVSEDSRIFFHCFLHYKGDYRVEPLYFPVSMDATMHNSIWQTAKSLYKQQRRWAWGLESTPYLAFNAIKDWKNTDRKKVIGHIFVQIYGFYSWATSAIIIAVVGWLPLLFGGAAFGQTVISGNLPAVTQFLMNIAMIGLVISATMSVLIMPKRKPDKKASKLKIFLEWIFIPVTIIFFGAIPCLEAQTRLMFGKYMGFFITPKSR